MTKKEIVKGSCIGALCSMSVLALLEPFGIDRIKEYRLLFIAAEGLLATMVAIVSICFAQLFFNQNAQQTQSRWVMAWQHLVVHLINIPLLSAVLLTFNGWMNAGDLKAYWFYQGEFTLQGYGIMCASVAIISVFVFVVLLILTFNKKLQLQLDEVRAINNMLESRLERMTIEQENQELQSSSHSENLPTITLEGSTGGLSITVSPTDIVYIESMSNYADICYMEEGHICHQQLRITMRQLREQLADFDYLISCHRAYIVNLNFVSSLSIRPGSDYYQLHLFGDEKQIPVSRSNTDEIKKRLK